ncbi:probable terpene synthase 11 [Abrus precatorius]|uniref:Probable terpene synthase 11 n=1 Tax=Abrus precatorius TaxID=3816 RepID=A0A8B8KMK9_ABRPR|nr:probable terpene synthase 11 [Abrus precatorius]
MSTNVMAVTELTISSLTTSLACHNSQSFPYHPCNSSLQTSKRGMIHKKLSIKSIAFRDKVPCKTDPRRKSLDQVKRTCQEALLNSNDPLRTLKMIDTIQGLGIGHHVEEEINVQLGKVWDWDTAQDLFATSIQFRLLRHNGWPTCSDVFKKFLDKGGNFKESLTGDIWGMLSLYEASYLGAKGEEVLQQAMDFSRTHLHQSLPYLGPEVGRQVAKALTLPRYLRMPRLEAKNYLEEYSQANNQIPALLELAKLDFDMVQSLYQRELAEISRWWKELELVERLGFARDRPAECFLWTVGIFPEPRFSNCRIELTKAICILLVMDDIFDTYGSLDELVLFTKAIKRWHLDAMDELPEYMKICYMALYNTTHEIAYKIQKEHGLTVVACLKRTWIDIFEAFLEEAKWFNNGHIPAYREYLDNGVITAGSYMALVHATFLIGDDLSKETISMMKPYPRLFSCSGEILRLWDDLGTSKEEQERGDNACSIQCLMRENDISDENVARRHIRQLIGNLWSELNGLAMTTSSLPPSIVKASLNMARTAQVIYQHGDDQSTFTVDDYVQTLLFTPATSY